MARKSFFKENQKCVNRAVEPTGQNLLAENSEKRKKELKKRGKLLPGTLWIRPGPDYKGWEYS